MTEMTVCDPFNNRITFGERTATRRLSESKCPSFPEVETVPRGLEPVMERRALCAGRDAAADLAFRFRRISTSASRAERRRPRGARSICWRDLTSGRGCC